MMLCDLLSYEQRLAGKPGVYMSAAVSTSEGYPCALNKRQHAYS